jgi:hypothetical protein
MYKEWMERPYRDPHGITANFRKLEIVAVKVPNRPDESRLRTWEVGLQVKDHRLCLWDDAGVLEDSKTSE